ncbi:MAG: hypothetical protein U9O94_08385 [Nanoarchaeota archaeon]|nr:hypothetical protein [Nanoarchaeota archaeon]
MSGGSSNQSFNVLVTACMIFLLIATSALWVNYHDSKGYGERIDMLEQKLENAMDTLLLSWNEKHELVGYSWWDQFGCEESNILTYELYEINKDYFTVLVSKDDDMYIVGHFKDGSIKCSTDKPEVIDCKHLFCKG